MKTTSGLYVGFMQVKRSLYLVTETCIFELIEMSSLIQGVKDKVIPDLEDMYK